MKALFLPLMTILFCLALAGTSHGQTTFVDHCLGGWTCRNGECIPFRTDYCNGVINCDDGTDERDCSMCGSGFLCDDGECTSRVSDRCNGVRDCSDGSDEENCKDLRKTIRDYVGLIVGVSVAGFVLLVLLPILICITICCCVFCLAGAAGAAAGEAATAGKHRSNVPYTQQQPAATYPPPTVTTQEKGQYPMESLSSEKQP